MGVKECKNCIYQNESMLFSDKRLFCHEKKSYVEGNYSCQSFNDKSVGVKISRAERIKDEKVD